jgi:hypothetical protein
MNCIEEEGRGEKAAKREQAPLAVLVRGAEKTFDNAERLFCEAELDKLLLWSFIESTSARCYPNGYNRTHRPGDCRRQFGPSLLPPPERMPRGDVAGVSGPPLECPHPVAPQGRAHAT